MADTSEFSPVHFFETFLTRTATALIVVSIGFLTEVAEPYLDGHWDTLFRIVQIVVVATLAITILPLFITWLRKCRGKGGEFEGFVGDAFRRACAKGFEITFLFLIGLEMLVAHVLSGVPGKVLLDLTLAVSMMTVGVTFWLINRQEDDDDEEDLS